MGGKMPIGYNKQYYLENRDAILAKNRAWREKNKERHLARAREWHHENRDIILPKKREYSHRTKAQRAEKLRFKKYGISSQTYDAMAALQKDCCAVCKQKTSLVVDHNHKTGVVRSLLCSPCNTAIGLFKEDSKRMLAAIEYLARSK